MRLPSISSTSWASQATATSGATLRDNLEALAGVNLRHDRQEIGDPGGQRRPNSCRPFLRRRLRAAEMVANASIHLTDQLL
jgi:hypothetical protein